MAAATTPPEDPTDVVGRRAAAFLIDVVLVGLIGLVVFAALRYRSYTGVPGDACTLLRKTADNPICLKVGSRVFLWHAGAAKTAVLVTLFFGLLNNVVLQSITGSTVGKTCFRLCVVDENGAKTHPLRMFGRWVFLAVDVGFCLVGCFMTLGTHPHRRIGDFVFGTYVVPMRNVGRPVVVAPDATDAPAGAGAPSSWTAPPVPAPAAKTAAVASAGASPQLKTPPGTAPTAPGEWGAVARPAPLVRSPQWATPPPTDAKTPPAVIESTTSPKWAVPPLPEAEDESEAEEASETDAEVDEPEADAEAETEAEAEAETDTEPEVEADAESETDADEPQAEAETGDEPAAASTESTEEIDPGPEVSEWSPVAKPNRRRGAKAGTASKAKDATWWDAALSSGDSEAEAEE